MHADVLITIVFAAFVALVALATGLVLLRARLQARAAEERAGDHAEEEQPVAPAR